MTINEKTFWDMMRNSISYLNANSNEWKKHEIIKDDVDKLIASEKKLAEANKTQNDNQTGGHVTFKRQEILEFSKPVYRLSCSLSHLARKMNDPVLLKMVNYSESALVSGEEMEIMSRFSAILNAAHNNIDSLGKYSFITADLDALDARYKIIAAIPDTINIVSGLHKSATRNIKDIIAETRLNLEDLDDVLEGIITNQIFLNGWFDVRKIKGRHSGGKKSNGNTPDDVPPAK